MGSIKQEAQKVIYNANEMVRSKTELAKSRFNSILSNLNAQFSGLVNGDIVGINANHIPQMKAEIDKYVEDLHDHLKKMKSNANTSKAFKGEYAKAVTEFVESVEIACGYVIDSLLSFKTQLDEVAEKYQAKDTDVASDIRTQAEELKH